MSFSGYQIRGDVLSTMKQAAGNYMPDYGNWRYKLAQPPPEEPEEPETPPVIKIPPPPKKPPTQELELWDDSETWETEGTEDEEVEGEGRKSYRTAYDGLTPAEQAEYEDYDDFVDESERYWKEHPEKYEEYLKNSGGYTIPGEQGGEGGVKTSGYIDPNTGERVTTNTEYYGIDNPNKKLGTPNKKRSPMQSRGAMPPTEQEVPQNPYADVDKFLAKQINLYDINGAVATKDIHDHVKIIMGDVKENVFFKKGKNSKETKNNKHEAGTIVDSMHKSFQEDLSADGTVDSFVQMHKENTISDSITDQEKYVFASMAHLKGVKPAIDENNHMVYPIPMPTGETFPVTNQWLTETIKKRTKPYGFAADFNKNKGAFFDAGRSGHPWDKDTIIMQNKKSIAANPDQLAALYIDKGLLHPDAFVDLTFEKEDQDEASPYTKSMGDNFSNKEFILNAIGDTETRKELEDNLADGMEKIAFAAYSRGKAEYDKENKKDNPTSGMSIDDKVKYYTS